MAGNVFFSVTMSLDGFVAPEQRIDDPDGQRWTAQWMEPQQWLFPQATDRPGADRRESDLLGVRPASSQLALPSL